MMEAIGFGILGAAVASAGWYVYVRGFPGVKKDVADVKADVQKVVSPTPPAK